MAPRLPKTRFPRSRMAASPPQEACDGNPPTADSVRAIAILVSDVYRSGVWKRKQTHMTADNNDKSSLRWLFSGTIERMFVARFLPDSRLVGLGNGLHTGARLISPKKLLPAVANHWARQSQAAVVHRTQNHNFGGLAPQKPQLRLILC